jgi:hypothetical protein
MMSVPDVLNPEMLPMLRLRTAPAERRTAAVSASVDAAESVAGDKRELLYSSPMAPNKRVCLERRRLQASPGPYERFPRKGRQLS